jgi:hypothetical protein
MEAKKNKVVKIKTGSGRVKDERAASSGGISDKAKVAKLIKASAQRANPSATNPAMSKSAHMARILGLFYLISRMRVSPVRCKNPA